MAARKKKSVPLTSVMPAVDPAMMLLEVVPSVAHRPTSEPVLRSVK